MDQTMKKKIAEIREWHEGKRDPFPPFTVFEAVGVMLDEIDRIEREYAEERAAHNARVTELCELEKENRKLRKELDLLQELAVKATVEREKERKYAQQEIERLREELNAYKPSAEVFYERLQRLVEERNKLIECLLWYADKTNYVQEIHHLRHGTLIGPAEAIYYDEGQRARDILHEIGVMVEWQKSANDMRTIR